MKKEERNKQEKKPKKTAEAKPSKEKTPQKKPQEESPQEVEQPSHEEAPKKTAKRNARGQFAKGHTKLGGRQMGTPNKNGNVRDRLKEQIEPFLDNIAENLLKVQREEGTAAMLSLQEKFMPYFMPKFSSMSIGTDLDRPISEEQRLLELDEQYTKKQISINLKALVVVDNDLPKENDDPDDDPNFDLSKLEEMINKSD